MRGPWPRARAGRPEVGAAAVEFALVVPLLLMILFGIISFGMVLAQNLALNNGAREGARFGVVDGKTCAAIKAAAKNAASSINMSSSQVIVSIARGQDSGSTTNPCSSDSVKPCAGSAVGDSLFVTTQFTSSILMPTPGFPDSVDLEGTGVFRCEFS